MRVFLLPNNWVGWQLTRWLKDQGEEIVGLAMHPSCRRAYGEQILESAGVDLSRVFDGSRLRDDGTVAEIRKLNADVAISLFFDYIFKPSFIDLFPSGVINLHPAYLPHNRGQHPNVWSIIDGTLAGVTLHYVDPGIDTGDIIAQSGVPVDAVDTGESLYRKLEKECVRLFEVAWSDVRDGSAPRQKQGPADGPAHRLGDLDAIDEIKLDEHVSAQRLLDIIRGRTFPPYKGTYFLDGERKVYLRLQLLLEEDLEGRASGNSD